MKIVSVMTTQSRGGAEFAAVEMLDALIERGHEPVMLTDEPALARDRRVPVRPIEIGPKLSTTSYRQLGLRWPLLLKRLREALEVEAPYDVLLLHYKKEQLLAQMLPKHLRPTLVWCEWGPVPFPIREGLPRRLYLRAADRCDLVMAISQGTKDSVCGVGVPDEKVIVVPNVLRTDEIGYSEAGRARVRAELGIPADAFVTGCISRFHPKKRNDVVVEAVIALDDPRAHLILAGDGETEAQLRAVGAPLGERLHVIPTPGDEVGDVLSAFDVSVFCPSPTEGQPRAVILGMLAERPCLSTGAEGVADMITPDLGGIASPENDPASLAPMLRRYLEDPSLVLSQGRAGRAYAERTYAAPVVAELLEGLFVDAGGLSDPAVTGRWSWTADPYSLEPVQRLPPQPLPPGRSGIDPDDVAASQHRRLIDAMESLCFEVGYPAVKIADLAARARVAKRAFYSHFADREACFIAAYERIDAEIFERIAAGAATEDEPLARIERGLGAMLTTLAEHPEQANLYVLEPLRVGGLATARRIQTLDQFADLYIALNAQLLPRYAQPTPMSRTRALAVVGAIELPVTTTLRTEGAAGLSALVPELSRTAYTLVHGGTP